jgi:hypothetical protein
MCGHRFSTELLHGKGPAVTCPRVADLGAGPELLSIVGSWGDPLDDSMVLMLRDYNAGRPTLRSLR